MSNFVDAAPLSNGHSMCMHKEQGGRHHMEDVPVFARNNYDGVPEGIVTEPYDYIAIFDGHGGSQASDYASVHLLPEIISRRDFWSGDDSEVLSAIRKGFISCHYNMWRKSKDWPQSSPGIMCTAGTTASVAFVRRGKVFVGHVGDSGIALGKTCVAPPEKHDIDSKAAVSLGKETDLRDIIFPAKRRETEVRQDSRFEALMLTKDHKPESPEERERIESLDGEVRSKSGVFRVVWKRPVIVRPDQPFADAVIPVNPVPFLAVARSLGDFWSYEEEYNEFVVSPVPDVAVHCFSMPKHRCLIAGSDGFWNVVRPNECLEIVEEAYRLQELWVWQCLKANKKEKIQVADLNIAELLVRKVLNRCELRKMRSDNVGIVVYYPTVDEHKIRSLVDNPSECKLYPWIHDPDQGIAQYRSSLMHLQNMVSCINNTKSVLSIMEIAYRIDTIGFTPRMRCNPLRDAPRFTLGDRDVFSNVDHFIPQCALVITREDESVRIPAYESLLLDDDVGFNGSARMNPLRRRNSDVLLSQRIKFLRTHSSQAIESSTRLEISEGHCSSYLNGNKRLRVAPTYEGEENEDSPPTFLSLPFSREDMDELNRLQNYPYSIKDH